jgi:hypothetical protein
MVILACDPFLKFHGSAPRRTRFDLAIADARLEAGLRGFQEGGARIRACHAPSMAMAGEPVNLFAVTASTPARRCVLHLAPHRLV